VRANGLHAGTNEDPIAYFKEVEDNMPDITPLTRKVLVIDFRPAGVPAHWNSSNRLISQYIDAMRNVSRNILQYQVVETLQVAEYPVLANGLRYTDTIYATALGDDKTAWRDANGNYLFADYDQIIQQFDLLQKVESAQIDEVWMFGGPYFGFYESRMVGSGAFWCNGPAIEQKCRRFVIMGFNYEREVKEMVHDYGHRAESLLAKHFGSEKHLRKMYRLETDSVPSNAYEQFLVDLGTVHRKPGGEEYGQDEFAWLTAMQPDWWPPTIDANLVLGSANAGRKPWYRSILGFFAALFGKK
jgi:hypothetical protein